MGPLKKIIIIILAALSVILLGVIIVSLATGWRIGGAKTASKPPVQEETTTKEEETSSKKEEETSSKTETEKETKETEMPTQKTEFPSADKYTTSDLPSLGDVVGFRWNAVDGGSWENLSGEALRLNDFDAVKGGWKAYILDDPAGVFSEYSVERFANISISGSAGEPEVLVDWSYVVFGDTGEGMDDAMPDSVYNGTWDDGTIDAYGAGRIVLYDFYYDGGKEYAVGAVMWPDGVDGAIALVRP